MGAEPRFGQPRGAPARAERPCRIRENSMGGRCGRPRNGIKKFQKFDCGVYLQQSTNLF